MVSYASLERFEGDYAVCEVEQISIFFCFLEDFSKECYMADVPVSMFYERNISANVGNVYSVEHDGSNVIDIIRLEEAETNRRIEWIKSIGRKI